MTDAEKFYDDVIAPELLKLGRACEERGMSFVASCSWEPGECGRTQLITKDAGIDIRMVYWAAASQGNIDRFIATAMDWAKKHGHSSVFLQQLGVK